MPGNLIRAGTNGRITRRTLLGQLAAAGFLFGQSDGGNDYLLRDLKRDHPRLILVDSDLARIRALAREHPLARKLRENLEHECEKLRAAPVSDFKLVGPRLLATSRRVLDRVYTLALMYRLDGKTEYLRRAVEELRAAAAFPSWNPSHFLDVAEMTHAFAIGYDWLYPALAAPERDWIRNAIVEKGLEPALAEYREPAAWVTATHNWNLVCNSGIAIGALAVAESETERAPAVLRNAFDSIPRAMATYAPDGGWPEGPAYWNYATRYIVCLMAALESALDTDRGFASAHGFDRTGRFRIYSTGPAGKTFNFADSADEAGAAPEMYWLARRYEEPVYAWSEQRETDLQAHVDALDLVWFYREARAPGGPDWPLDAWFTGTQTVFLRSAWDDPLAIYVGVKGGDNKANHAHLDLGSFVLDAGGVRWAYDPGPEDYNVPAYFGNKRFTYFKTSTEAHNTVLVDGANQDTRAEAKVTRREFGPNLSWAQIDLRAAYPGKLKTFQRKIGLVQKQAVVIQDTLAADQPFEPLWGMMTEADISVNGQMAELRKNDWVLSCEILTPHHAVFDVVSKQNTKKLVARVGGRVTDLDLTIVLTPHKAGQPKPAITIQLP